MLYMEYTANKKNFSLGVEAGRMGMGMGMEMEPIMS